MRPFARIYRSSAGRSAPRSWLLESSRVERWHTDLLDHMTLEVPEVRPRVISAETFSDLSELMRFRHFKRYYFNLAYDWERLDAIVQRLKRVHPRLDGELDQFERLAKRL